MATGAELTYTSTTAMNMANAIFGAGVTVTGASYTGPVSSAAVYSNGELAPGVVPSNTGVILSTGRAADFTQSSGDPNRAGSTTTNTTGTDNSAQFNTIAGANTYDAVWLDADFIPTGNLMTIRFRFASEEYPEYVNSVYNDVIGVWVNGTHVPIQVGNGKTSVNNINGINQENLVKSNTNDAFNTEMDGFTITLTLKMVVNPGIVNSIRIGIADTSDASWDSNLLIAGDSVQTTLVADNDTVTVNPNGVKTVNVLGNDKGPAGSVLTITHVNDVPVVVGTLVTLPSGQTIRLNADGTFTVFGDSFTEVKTFTYTVKDQFGNTDTALVNMTSAPCFVAGTLILTPDGERAVETLLPGDLVLTHDDGAQPVRWIGQRTVPARGVLAPVRIKANTLGDHRTLLLSPQHRVLIRDGLAELLFGEAEVLVAAKDLVNDRSIRAQEGGDVTYVHVLFDRHQVVFSEGLATESFLPGPQVTAQLERQIVDEIAVIFPELNPRTGDGYGPAARRTLRGHEAQVLFAANKVA